MLNDHSFSPEKSRTWLAVSCLGILGFFVVAIAGAMGEAATRNLLLWAVAGVFLTCGGLLGLLAAHQVCKTHVTGEPAEESPNLAVATTPTVETQAPRGIAALLTPTEPVRTVKRRR